MAKHKKKPPVPARPALTTPPPPVANAANAVKTTPKPAAPSAAQGVADAITAAAQTACTVAQSGKRGMLPLWRIKGVLTLTTPLHLGTGHDEDASPDGKSISSACIARDHKGKPYIPASSLKGALRALAVRYKLPEKCIDLLIGWHDNNKDDTDKDGTDQPKVDKADARKGDTQPGAVEFCNAYMEGKEPLSSGLPNYKPCEDKGKDHDKGSALIPHAVRDRDYGTAREHLLFHEHVVPPGAKFDVEFTIRGLDVEIIKLLLEVLQAANAKVLNAAGASGKGSPLRLGGGKAANQGQVTWEIGDVKKLDISEFWKYVQNGQANDQPIAVQAIWTKCKNQTHLYQVGKVTPIPDNGTQPLILKDLELKFHTPFLVYMRNPEKKPRDKKPVGIPYRNHHKKGVLPSSSLHGALRNQAERILRTVGLECDPAYKVDAVDTMKEVNDLDLAALLFGAPGWRSLLTSTDFVVQQERTRLLHHNAIDRLTGGGKDSALFTIEVYDCPTLKGDLRLDLRRLDLLGKLDADIPNQLLGLLAHVLRDLDEGDIPLGYGVAKGYGACINNTVTNNAVAKLKAQVNTPPGVDQTNVVEKRFEQALEAFAEKAKTGTTPLAQRCKRFMVCHPRSRAQMAPKSLTSSITPTYSCHLEHTTQKTGLSMTKSRFPLLIQKNTIATHATRTMRSMAD